MATLNQVMFIGRLGKDPEVLKVTGDGKPYIKFSLAVDQAKDQDAMWLNVTAWDKQSEAIEKYAIKGTLVFVEGKLFVHKYTDKPKQERISVEINASNVQILEKRKKGSGSYCGTRDSSLALRMTSGRDE